MKTTAKILAALLAAVMCFALISCSAEDDNTFKVGMECAYAPFNWLLTESNSRTAVVESGGYADGYDVQIAKKLADALGKELLVVKLEWDGLTLAAQSGTIDAIIAGMSPTEDRKLTIDFSDPYYESELVIVIRKDGAYTNATSLADFAGAKITGQLNTFHYSVIDQIPDVDKQTAMETFPAMITSLEAGVIDGYISEKPGAVSAAASNPDLTYIEFSEGNGFEASPADVAVAVGLKKGSEYLEPINEALAKISKEERQQLMDEAVANQPLSEE